MHEGPRAPAACSARRLQRRLDPSGRRCRRAFAYPPAARIAQVDDYHGTRVADPYRWLEQVDDAQTRQWISAENALAQPYLEGDPGARDDQEAADGAVELRALRACPCSAAAATSICATTVCRTRACCTWPTACTAQPRVLLDPNTLSKDATIALAEIVPSPDGKIARVQPVGRRHRLAHLAFPRRGDRHGSARRAALHQVRAGGVDCGLASAVYYARYPAARGRLRATTASSARSTGTSWARRRTRTSAVFKVDRSSDAQSVRADLRRRPLRWSSGCTTARNRPASTIARSARTARPPASRAAVRYVRRGLRVRRRDRRHVLRAHQRGCAERAADRDAGDVGRRARTGAS